MVSKRSQVPVDVAYGGAAEVGAPCKIWYHTASCFSGIEKFVILPLDDVRIS
jgi:hypothetical protein